MAARRPPDTVAAAVSIAFSTCLLISGALLVLIPSPIIGALFPCLEQNEGAAPPSATGATLLGATPPTELELTLSRLLGSLLASFSSSNYLMVIPSLYQQKPSAACRITLASQAILGLMLVLIGLEALVTSRCGKLKGASLVIGGALIILLSCMGLVASFWPSSVSDGARHRQVALDNNAIDNNLMAALSGGGGLLLALGPPSATGKLKAIMLTATTRPAATCTTASSNPLPTITESLSGGSETASVPAFLCGNVKRPWGSNVVIAEKERVLKRVCNRDSAISKHVAWLRDIQNKRAEQNLRRAEQRRLKEERMREFKSKQAMKRAKLFEAAAEDDDCCSVNSDCTDSTAASSALSSVDDMTTNNANKPAWALTEEAAQREEEERDAAEEEELLCFVDGLDFEEYSQDHELSILMDQVKNRIQALQKEKNVDESRLEAIMKSELAALRAERLRLAGNDGGLSDVEGRNRSSVDDDDGTIASIAETVRSHSSAISAVHSHRSMKALISRTRDKLALDIGEGGMTPPLCITHVDEDRFDSKEDVSRLPFLNRNPAI